MKAPLHQWSVRVYYEDTDTAGVVYHANYLKFMERARTECLRALGWSLSHLKHQGVQFVVRQAEIDFYRPAVLEDELLVTTGLAHVGGASLTFEQKIYLAVISPTTRLCQAKIKMACVDHNFKPGPVPTRLIKELQGEY
jgi:acyl-CoA thioester hydrolase